MRALRYFEEKQSMWDKDKKYGLVDVRWYDKDGNLTDCTTGVYSPKKDKFTRPYSEFIQKNGKELRGGYKVYPLKDTKPLYIVKVGVEDANGNINHVPFGTFNTIEKAEEYAVSEFENDTLEIVVIETKVIETISKRR